MRVWVGLLVLSVGVGLTVRAQTHDEPQKIEQVPDDAKVELAQEAVGRMRSILSAGLAHLADARKAKDVVKLNCVNDKLIAIKGLLRVSEQADVVLQESLTRNDSAAAAHEYEKIIIARYKAEKLLSEIETCVGELAVYSGDTDIEIDVIEVSDKAVTSGDEYIYDPVAVERPPAASPYQ